VAQNAWVFTSPSNDLRLLGGEKFKPEQVSDRPRSGFASGILAWSSAMGSTP